MLPSAKYKKSFLEAQEEKKKQVGKIFTDASKTSISKKEFSGFLKALENESKGINLKKDYVATTTWWLVNGDEFLGGINIRHEFTSVLLGIGGYIEYGLRPSARGKGFGTEMLVLALPRAKELGFEKVLITCDDENIPSARVIEKNGGVLENIFERKEGELEGLSAGKMRRYWITL